MHTLSPRFTFAILGLVLIGTTPFISIPALGLEESVLEEPVLIAKRKKVPKSDEVAVTQAEIETRLVAGSPYHYLNGVIENRGKERAHNISFYFEIYQKGTENIIDAGSFIINPSVVRPGGTIPFTRNVSADGTVRITLVRWSKDDRSPLKHLQMQLFDGTQPTEK